MTDEMTPEQVSEYMSSLAKKRKKPYLPFKDKAYAKAMSLKAKEKRDEKKPDEAEVKDSQS